MSPLPWRLMLASTVLLAGCASPPTAPTAPAGATGTASAPEPPRPGQPPPAVLAGEVRWMQALFDGTPVAIGTEPDGAMRVTVPMEFSFDAQSAAPKPALRAVMDRVSTTLSRQPSAKLQIGAAGAATRAAAMRAYFSGKGVLALRVSTVAPPPGDGVLMRVVPGAVAIDKLDDSALPQPKGAFPANKAPAKP